VHSLCMGIGVHTAL